MSGKFVNLMWNLLLHMENNFGLQQLNIYR